MSSCLIPKPDGPYLVPSLPAQSAEQDESVDEDIDFSLVIPTYNESANIPLLIADIAQVLDAEIAGQYEIIVVDDHSPDHTSDVVQDTAKDYPQLKLVCRASEHGLATAVVRGWQVARGSRLGVIDGDLQHPPAVLAQLLESVRAGADIAVASRYLEKEGLSEFSRLRRILSEGAQSIARILLGSVLAQVTDPMSGCFVLRRTVIADKPLSPSGYKILLEVLAHGTAQKIVEVPFVFRRRLHGQTKVSWREYLAYLWHLAKMWVYLRKR